MNQTDTPLISSVLNSQTVYYGTMYKKTRYRQNTRNTRNKILLRGKIDTLATEMSDDLFADMTETLFEDKSILSEEYRPDVIVERDD